MLMPICRLPWHCPHINPDRQRLLPSPFYRQGNGGMGRLMTCSGSGRSKGHCWICLIAVFKFFFSLHCAASISEWIKHSNSSRNPCTGAWRSFFLLLLKMSPTTLFKLQNEYIVTVTSQISPTPPPGVNNINSFLSYFPPWRYA